MASPKLARDILRGGTAIPAPPPTANFFYKYIRIYNDGAGRGQGQVGEITAINQATKTITVGRVWYVPDTETIRKYRVEFISPTTRAPGFPVGNAGGWIVGGGLGAPVPNSGYVLIEDSHLWRNPHLQTWHGADVASAGDTPAVITTEEILADTDLWRKNVDLEPVCAPMPAVPKTAQCWLERAKRILMTEMNLVAADVIEVPSIFLAGLTAAGNSIRPAREYRTGDRAFPARHPITGAILPGRYSDYIGAMAYTPNAVNFVDLDGPLCQYG